MELRNGAVPGCWGGCANWQFASPDHGNRADRTFLGRMGSIFIADRGRTACPVPKTALSVSSHTVMAFKLSGGVRFCSGCSSLSECRAGLQRAYVPAAAYVTMAKLKIEGRLSAIPS
jgi:hypothetical protein